MSESGSTRRPVVPDLGPRDSSHASAQLASTDFTPAPLPPISPDDRTVISAGGAIEPSASQTLRIEAGKILEGEQLGPLILKEYVGGGGMGAVFRALDTTLNRDVAVKLLSGGQAKDDETLRRFKNEAQSAARLDHDNIARVFYVGEDRGVHYIVFEFIEGVNIRELVEARGPLPVADAVSYTLQIAEALAHASQRDVIHRDIKPSNVLITPDGKAKLVDMGLARLQQVSHAENDLTVSGVTLGTFDYISPEQARDPRSADVRSDIYSLGCSLYYMLTGRPPFPEGTVLQKLLQHQADHPPDPREIRPDLPAETTDILSRMLAKNPDRRYQLPGELIQDLLVLAEQVGLPVNAPATLIPLGRPKASWGLERHLPWLVPLVALVVIVLVLDYLWSRASLDDDSLVVSSSYAPTTAKAAPIAPDGEHGPSTNNRASTATPKRERPRGAVPRPANPRGPGSRVPSNVAAIPPGSPRLTAPPLSAALYAAPPSSAQLGPPPGIILPVSANPGAPDSGASKGIVPPAERREGVLVVSDTEQGSDVFPSLAAACSQASSGDRVELRFNGRREETPFELSNAKLTITAGYGFQPIVVFKPADPLRYPRSMLTLVGGQISFVNVHLEFDVGDATADRWTFIELRRVDLVRFEKCSLTVRNPKQPGDLPSAAFFDVRAAAGGETMTMGSSDDTLRSHYDEALSIELKDCVARGQATLIRTDPLQAVNLSWDNGLLATTGRLLISEGSADVPRVSEQLQIQLRHVTADVRGGLVRLINREDAPYQLSTDIKSTDSILVLGNDASLIDQVGVSSTRDLRSRVNWNGERNFYDGFDVFWKINSIGTGETEVMRFADWCTFWGDNHEQWPTFGSLAWMRRPHVPSPVHLSTPESYVLAANPAQNPAHGGASDGSDAGLRLDRLPEMPTETGDSSLDSASDFDVPMQIGQ